MKDKVILISSDQLGTGDAELGRSVLETFLVVLKQRDELPAAIFCMNRGVFTLTRASFAHVHLAELAAAGVRVLACGTCVDFYDVREQLAAGEVSGMAVFVELAATHEVLTIA